MNSCIQNKLFLFRLPQPPPKHKLFISPIDQNRSHCKLHLAQSKRSKATAGPSKTSKAAAESNTSKATVGPSSKPKATAGPIENIHSRIRVDNIQSRSRLVAQNQSILIRCGTIKTIQIRCGPNENIQSRSRPPNRKDPKPLRVHRWKPKPLRAHHAKQQHTHREDRIKRIVWQGWVAGQQVG